MRAVYEFVNVRLRPEQSAQVDKIVEKMERDGMRRRGSIPRTRAIRHAIQEYVALIAREEPE